MADVIGNIQLRTTGGDESASEVKKATDALDGIRTSSSQMEGQFAHKFEHIGLKLFAGELIRTSGLGGEARVIIGTLQLAMNSASAVFGASAPQIMLVVAAFAALAAIANKLNNNLGHTEEALDKQRKTNSDAIAGYDKAIKSITDYGNAMGRLPPLYDAWLNAEKRLRTDGIEAQKIALAEEIKLLEIRTSVMEMSNVQQQIMLQRELAKEMWELAKATIGRGKAVDALANSLKNERTPEQIKQTDELKAKLAQLRVEYDRLGKGVTQSIDDQIKSIEKSEEAWNKTNEAATKYWKDWAKAGVLADKENEKLAKKMASDLASPMGDAFAKMIVEGKDFGESMKEAFKQMAEKIISDIVRIEIEWAILSAMGFPAGGMGSFGGFMATGGDTIVDRPTMFMAGEAGPERATFTPLSGGSSSSRGGGGGSIHIGSITTHVSGVNDPDQIARQIGQKIVQQIRGHGQINFSRT